MLLGLGAGVAGVALVAAAGCAPEVTPPAQLAPAPLEEIVSSPPAPGMVWVAGCWHRDGATYVWLPGHWDSPPPAATAASTTDDTDP